MGSKSIRLTSLFGPSEVVCDLDDLGEEKILHTLIEDIGNTGALLDVAATQELLLAQKCCGLSYLTPEIAVFHARVPGMKRSRIAIGIAPRGVKCCWDLEETGLVRLFVLVLAPFEQPADYMRTMTALKNICSREGFLENLVQLTEPIQVWEYINQIDEQLPEYVSAGDIMGKAFRCLRDTDTLSTAIDSFCRFRVTELPVLDSDGDLIGVVSEDELIRVCLPDYITWMEDLSPVLDFQPFTEILRREKDMPAMEIMMLADRYATVDEQTPAIQVAKVMMRRDVRQVFVVRGKKLMGIISIQDFVSKVLRA